MDRLEEIKNSYAEYGTDGLPAAWMIGEIEKLRTQLATLEARYGITPGMASEIEDAHRALTDLGVLDNGKELLAERIERIDGSEWKPVGEALTALYESYHSCDEDSLSLSSAVREFVRAYNEWLD